MGFKQTRRGTNNGMKQATTTGIPSPFDYAQGQDDDSKGFAQDDGFVK